MLHYAHINREKEIVSLYIRDCMTSDFVARSPQIVCCHVSSKSGTLHLRKILYIPVAGKRRSRRNLYTTFCILFVHDMHKFAYLCMNLVVLRGKIDGAQLWKLLTHSSLMCLQIMSSRVWKVLAQKMPEGLAVKYLRKFKTCRIKPTYLK